MPASRGYQPGYGVVAPAPTPRTVQGPSTGAAIDRAGRAVEGVADDLIAVRDQQRRQDEQIATRRNSERLQAIEAEQREAIAEQRRINRLKAGNAAVDLELSATALRADLDEQLETGRLKPDEYQGKLAEGIDKRAAALRADLDPDSHVDFDQASIRPIRAAQIGAASSLKAHRKRTAVAELDKGRDSLVRLAVTDLPRALAGGAGLYAQDGPYAAQIGVDQAQKQGSSFREAATRAHFQQRIANAQNDARALGELRKAVAGNRDMDPLQQSSMLASIDSRTGVLENRARNAGERLARQQDQAFKALSEQSAQGLPLAPDFVQRTMATLKGSPLADAAVSIVKGSVETAGFGSKPIADMDRILQEEAQRLRAGGTDPAASQRFQKLQTVRNAAESAYRTDPWRAASDRGLIDLIPPLDTTSLAGVGASLTARMAMAPDVDAAAGRTVSPLRPAEAEGLADTLAALPVQERVKMLGQIQQAIGPERLRAVAEQMKAKDGTLAIAAAYQAAGIKTQAGLNLGELVLRGAEARKNKQVKVDEAAETGLEAQVRKVLDGAYATPAATTAAVEASMNVWAGMAADGRKVTPAEAIRMATGGVTEHNGQKIPMPYGWDERRVKRSIASITPEYVQSQAGGNAPLWIGTQQMLPEDVARMIPRAQLRSAGPNRYAIRIGDNLLTIDGRRPFTIQLPGVD